MAGNTTTQFNAYNNYINDPSPENALEFVISCHNYISVLASKWHQPNMTRKVKINGYTYSVDCGESRGTLCGDVVNPVNYKDCSIYSKLDNSCCFYKYYYKR